MATTGGAGRPEKRKAITRAATTVFGREGYVRASMDAIAAEAGVSKRTVYNHFADKETLFLSVALRSAAELTERLGELMAKHLDRMVDPRRGLVDFAVERADAVLAAGEHGALGRAIRAEVANIPADVLEAWLEAGPAAAQRDLAERFAALAERGLLAVVDAELAAEQFTLLTFHGVAERSFWGALPVAGEEVERIAAAGVDAFLRIHGGPAAAVK
ncbi:MULTISPECIES: TetR/AcrR family transcriptional regulator [Kitasatospora]|uniref:TetR/AcrR family transcriptional regulator n=1 Tax=Kitasatospora cathayae TaxID=3004092 RepID=A0ABY7Q3S9_9ACTN|nr:TetR/AcrR family transcriptional regulator [Kitasatospora sp. HUAS 3-15]WBP87370.1 TetR/AcrR family transcriptional regulator [Kitasatospora sp. HUAS 3-15]